MIQDLGACAKEELPLYRHKDIYSWNEEYQKYKFFKDEDFKKLKYIENLIEQGVLDYAKAHKIGNWYDEPVPSQRWYFKNRYGSLDQNTRFFKNLIILRDIRQKSASYPEYVLKAAIHNIDQKFVNFEILYTWIARRRFFNVSSDGMLMPEANDDYFHWNNLVNMRREAFKNGHKNCAKFKEFIENEFT